MRLILRTAGMVAIAAFWAVMWGLLIRSELHPGDSALREVPLALVLKQVFQHEQSSDLFLRENGSPIGHLRLTPKHSEDGNDLQIIGNLEGGKPASGDRLHAAWDATLRLDEKYQLRSVHASVTTRAAPPSNLPVTTVEFSGDLITRRGWYRYSEGRAVMAELNFTLDEDGLAQVLQQWGVGPEWKKQAPAFSPGTVEVAGRLTRFTLHEVPVDATEVTVKAGGQTWIDVYLNQIGQVLQIKTLWGWTLEGE